MFPAVCYQFANAMGRHSLIPSTSVEESTRIVPFNVVAKRKKRRWIFFHKVEYMTYDFPLHDVLIGRTVLESKVDESKFCSYNPESTYSLSGKFGADIMKDIMDASLSASDKVTISAKLGELTLSQIKDSDSFMGELMTKQLDMKHPLIKQVHKDRTAVLCVIRAVVRTADKAEIKRIDNTDGKITVNEKISGTIDFESGASANRTRDITLEKGTTLAYKVWELRVNTKNGMIVPVLTNDLVGGFHHSHMDVDTETDAGTDEIDAKSSLQHLEEKLQPLRDMSEADSLKFKSAILILMKCPSDIDLLSKLLPKAEEANLTEDRKILEEQFVQKEAAWTILSLAGINTKESVISHKEEATPILTAVAHVMDAISEVESQELERVCQCKDEQIRALSKVLESAVTSTMPITINEQMLPVLEEPAHTILTTLDYTIYKEDLTILPPKEKSVSQECLFCVLYSLSQ